MNSSRRRPRVERETFEYAAMMRRMIRAHGRRVAHADPEDLAELIALHDALDAAIADAIAGQRAHYGRSWADIGRGTGTTRQAAQMRYGKDSTSRPTSAELRVS